MARFIARRLGQLILALGCAAAALAVAPDPAGGFGQSDGRFDPAGFRDLRQRVRLWDSWAGKNANQGSIRRGPFILKSHFSMELAGYPDREGIFVGWEDAKTGQRQRLAPRGSPLGHWNYYRWTVPANWRGRSVYLVAIDASPTDWVGISDPDPPSGAGRKLLELAGAHLWISLLTLLPGLALAAWCARKRRLPPEIALAITLCSSGVAALLAFYLYYLLGPSAGKALAMVLIIGSAAVVAAFGRGTFRTICRQLAPIFSLCLSVGVFYSAILFLYGGSEAPTTVAMDRYVHNLPPDPLLPYWLGERLASGQPVRPFFSDWLSSDRPPLQTGFDLLLHPFISPELGYQVLGVVLQCWVLYGLWILLRLAAIAAPDLSWVLGCVVATGFTLVNATYVWSKLLPTGFLLIAAALITYRPGRSALLLGLSSGLAMMGHGGSAFALIALGGFTLAGAHNRSLRFLGIAGAAFIWVMIPWSLYQHWGDPPGNRLLKWHLAGALALDSRSFGQALADAYRHLTWTTWLQDKRENLAALFTDRDSSLWRVAQGSVALIRADRWSEAARNFALSARLGGFLHLFQTLGILNLGLVGLWWHRPDGVRTASARLGRKALGWSLACAAVWIALMFVPGSTVNHQGTYFLTVGMLLAGSIGLRALAPAIAGTAITLHLLWFYAIWLSFAPRVYYTPALLPSAEPAMAALIGCALIPLVFSLRVLGRQSEVPGPNQ